MHYGNIGQIIAAVARGITVRMKSGKGVRIILFSSFLRCVVIPSVGVSVEVSEEVVHAWSDFIKGRFDPTTFSHVVAVT